MNNNKKVEHLHVNTGGKQLSKEELKEVQDFLKSDEFKEMVKKSKEQDKRVKESKIAE
ncbi:hypothetical protein [Staphylococcus epidermidis]|jgi:hypothetical protein|uniref:hypothetical protein n=1 Tax=Staphylococcus epidermidis TaxID=1282 RepID=UPI0015934C29|nr:hypothetical protein [Staphylococcus epidermidis]